MNECINEIENDDFVLLSSEVQIHNDEDISLDVIFQFHTYINDESSNVGGINVKVYDEKWCDMLYAADADGAHEHIFSSVVKQIKKNIPKLDFGNVDDNYDGERFQVWGRVAVMDCNFHAFQLDKNIGAMKRPFRYLRK